jgi:hypothetical protein
MSLTVGVGSNDEHPFATVGSSGVGSSDATPRRVVPHFGQRSDDFAEAFGEMARNVLHDRESRS